MNRLTTKTPISISVAFVFVYSMIDIFAPDIPADFHSIFASSAAITTAAIVAIFRFAAWHHIANTVKAHRTKQPHRHR